MTNRSVQEGQEWVLRIEIIPNDHAFRKTTTEEVLLIAFSWCFSLKLEKEDEVPSPP